MYLTKSVKPHLTDREKKKIIADYIETGQLRETARRNNCSPYTAKKVLDENEDVKQKLTEKKEQNTKDFLQFMQDKNDEIQSLLAELLKGMKIKAKELDDTDIKGLSTAFGIVMDKQLKMVEMCRGNANNEQITKVRELLDKLEDEANK